MLISKNRFYLIWMMAIVILIITGTCKLSNAGVIPFGLEWGQTKTEVRLKVEKSAPLKERDNVLYYEIKENTGTPSVHFVFDKSAGLFWVMMLATCDDPAFAEDIFDQLHRYVAYSSSKLVHSEGDLMYVYYNAIADTYILLNGYREDGKYKVILNYEQAKTSDLKKYGK